MSVRPVKETTNIKSRQSDLLQTLQIGNVSVTGGCVDIGVSSRVTFIRLNTDPYKIPFLQSVLYDQPDAINVCTSPKVTGLLGGKWGTTGGPEQ